MFTTDQKTADNHAIHLILGGARSGKSQYAEQCAQTEEHSSKEKVFYIATAQPQDQEMSERIAHHQQQRPRHWHTIEAPLHLAQVMIEVQTEFPGSVILIDCLTLWVTNCLLQSESTWQHEKQALLDCLMQSQSPIIMVSNEVGWGIVPLGELNRRFVDESGRLHQQIAKQANRVSLVVAGIPLQVK